MQEVFLRVMRARERYRPTARFSTWLYRIAFNLAVNQTERAPRPRSLDAPARARTALAPRRTEPPTARGADPAEPLERDDVVRAVRAAIASPARDAAHGAGPGASTMSCPTPRSPRCSARARRRQVLVHRARENLRARLAPFLQEELA